MKTKLPVLTSLVLLFAVGLCAAQTATPTKPNFVIIFVDDLGYGDIGPFGSKLNRTPHLDRMATEGRRFTSFYAAPVCSVSRAQLLTGCYGPRVSVPGVFFPAGPAGLNPKEETIAERLKPQGYATLCIGKWHLGDQPQFLPTRQGFDHYLGIPYSNDMQRTSVETGERVVPLVRDDKVEALLTDEAQDTITARYTEEAVKFLHAHTNDPFFLYFAHTAVHTPIHPGKAFQGKSKNGRFGDWVEEVDWSVGQVLDTLRELKLAENTFVLFTSDNGPWLIKGKDAGTAGPLRGGKGSTWEGGVREPTIAWWPGRIEPGTSCDTVAATIDVLPTLVKLAGGTVPTDRVIDGRDFSHLLFGQGTHPPREAHYYFRGYNLQAVRQGPWKLAIAPQPETMGRGTAPDASGKEPRLYNLDEDIGERTNLAAQYPEVVKRLLALTEKMTAELGGKEPSGRRPAGKVDNPVMLYPANNPPRKKKKSTAHVKPVPVNTLKVGDALASAQAPQVAGKPFTLTCTVEPKPDDCVIVSHGGSAVGYTLYLKDGRVVFAVRNGEQVTRVTSDKLPGGPLTLKAQLSTDGKLLLSVNGEAATPASAGGVLPKQPAEDLNLGYDADNTVDDYDGSKQFGGTLKDLDISVG